MIGEGEALAFERCIAEGGVVLFPTDTVYGLGCDPADDGAVRRMYLLKNRPVEKKSAQMYFSLDGALAALPDLGPNTTRALRSLLPGPVTVLLPSAEGRFGLRVPKLEAECAALAGIGCPVLQTSANLSGGTDPRRLDDVPREIREAVNLQLDGGELTGVASTVVDLGGYEHGGVYEVVRAGALPAAGIASLLG